MTPFFHFIPEFTKQQESSLLYTDKIISPSFHHLGGVFNSFFPYDISTITGTKTFGLQLICKTGTHVRIWLHTPKQPPEILLEAPKHPAHSAESIKVPSFEPKEGQRLTVEIKSEDQEKPADYLLSAIWGLISPTSTNRVHLAVVWCTYNNDKIVSENLETLVNHPVWEAINADLIIVDNNGPESKLTCSGDRIHHFKQTNVGGSGGFRRGIVETTSGSLQGNDYTHILLMDDDVTFHPEIIQRAIRFHEHSASDSVIGASMFQLENPSHLHEAGGLFRSKSSLGSYTDVPKGPLTSNSLEKLGRAKTYHYNAWWFCSFSKKAVEKSGLPLPIFIHGDDMEYGLRLNRNGFNVYCPGGVSLWHAAFENKPLTWIRYFDFRNALIRLLSQPGQWQNPPSIARTHLRRVVRRAIIKNDYGAAAMALRAYRDLAENEGKYDVACYETKISELRKEYHDSMPPETGSSGRRRFIGKNSPRKWWEKPIAWFKYATINLHTLPIPTHAHYRTQNARYAWWDVPFFADIIVIAEDGSESTHHRSVKIAVSLTKQTKNLIKEHPTIK